MNYKCKFEILLQILSFRFVAAEVASYYAPRWSVEIFNRMKYDTRGLLTREAEMLKLKLTSRVSMYAI